MDNVLDKSCSSCINWEIDGSNPLLKTTQPKFFPTAAITSDDHLLSPMHLSYDNLKEFLSLAYENYVGGTWFIDNFYNISMCTA
jgi:hypothetical protein